MEIEQLRKLSFLARLKGIGKGFVYYSVTPTERASHIWLMRHLLMFVPNTFPSPIFMPGARQIAIGNHSFS